jgi:hypothetical protein
MYKLLEKNGKGGGFWFLFGSFEYVQIFWSTLIGGNFKKKHVEFSFIFIQASLIFMSTAPI